MLTSAGAFAQVPVADFTISDSSGCAPVTVSFKDASAGNPTSWNWDFGNGQLSNLQNPVVSYYQPGVYTVQLVVRNANGTNGITKTGLITVNASPIASFTADKKNSCLNGSIQFSDQSSDPAGTIQSWEWNFGDNSTSSAQNPAHVYAQPGFYTVSLKVTSTSGCSGSNSQYRFIRILSGVIADFNPVPPVSCQGPYQVSLQNLSSGPGDLNYSWDFGNGNTSVAANPVTTYPADGTFTISLKAVSDFGCMDTIQKTISLSGTASNFSGPDTVCVQSSGTFQNISPLPASDVFWESGGNTYPGNAVTIPFDAPGTIPVKMVIRYAACVDSITRPVVVVPKPAIRFSADRQQLCRVPGTVKFADNTAGATAWFWNFGDGATATTQNPTHTYTQPGTFTVSLAVTGSAGCTDTLVKTGFIQVALPEVTVTNLSTGGCIPFTFKPTVKINSLEPVTGYQWDFGNGITSTSATPSVTYTDSGTYSVKLIVFTASGCSDTALYPNAVRTGKPATVDFDYTLLDKCASGGIQFNDRSATNVSSYLWDFGDGTTSSEKNPIHMYVDTGKVSVKLTVTRNGCPNSLLKPALIDVRPPIAKFDFTQDCTQPGRISFRDKSLLSTGNGLIRYRWSFGDPLNSIDSVANPVFNYASVGKYSVVLTVSDDVCSHSFTAEVAVEKRTADFSASNSTICRNSALNLVASDDPLYISTYQWTIGTVVINGGPSINPTLTTNGTFDVTLSITDKYGCTYTKTIPNYVTVSGPEAKFEKSASSCLPGVTEFTDRSVSPAAIASYTYDFGDGSVQTFNAGPFTHQYADTGTYAVILLIKDAAGCTSTYQEPTGIRIDIAKAWFSMDTTTFCPGFPVNFVDSSQGANLQYSWSFGDGTISSDKNPVHTYAEPGTYTIGLKITNAAGCADSVTRTSYINIQKPVTTFTVSDSVSLCPPFEVLLESTGSGNGNLLWDFGDGTTGTQISERHFFNTYGDYLVTLYSKAAGGCVDSAVRKISVVNPASIKVDYSPIDACNELKVDFNISAPPSTVFNFAFGDGQIDSTQNTQLSHFYPDPGLYFPLASFRDAGGCIVNAAGKSPIRVRGVKPFFGVDKKTFCDTGLVTFTNYSIGNDPVQSFVWDFGDNTSSTIKDVTHQYNQPGFYPVSLTVNTASGCTDKIFDTVIVYRTPVAQIDVRDTICVNTPELFAARLLQADTSVVSYNWTFGNSGNSQLQNPVVSFPATGDFTVTLDTKIPFGCATSTSKIISVEPLPTIVVSDTVIIAGKTVQIPVQYTGPIVSYNWQPSASLDCADCPSPKASPAKTTRYQVTVTDRFGCTATQYVTVMVICGDQNLFVPNTFSPNGDGSNDWFYPRGSGIFQVRYLRIFNRWGEQVFERTNFPGNQATAGWDGKYKGKAVAPDVYAFVIEVVCSNSETYQYKGTVMVLR